MTELTGIGVSPGVGTGVVRRLAEPVGPPPDAPHDGDAAAHTRAARDALTGTARELDERAARAGGAPGDVLAAQALMAADPAVAADVERRVAAGATAARAVYEAFGVYRERLAAAGGRMSERVRDIDDVRDRTVARLLGVPMPEPPRGPEPFVLVARDLAPADTAHLADTPVVALVTEEGGPTGHTAIIARSLGLPAVVACPGALALPEGEPVTVDGTAGTVAPPTTPPAGSSPAGSSSAGPSSAGSSSAGSSSAGPPATRDRVPRRRVPPEPAGADRPGGTARVALLANIGSPRDVAAAVANGAEGVGLLRTEFLFLDRAEPPTEEEQVAAYREVLDAFPGRPVVVRVLDAGADKPLAFLPPPAPEPNPALGVRGLRLLRRHPAVLDGQLSALAQAAQAQAGRGTAAVLRVMAPMVVDVEDAEYFVDACAEHGLAEAGVMIEVPAAALRAVELAGVARFFSIGTNDLAQYTMAADRGLGALARLHDPWHPALLGLVERVAEAAGGVGIDCGVCGEAAADPTLAPVLAGLGVTSLSMVPAALPGVRAALAGLDRPGCLRLARIATGSPDAAHARREVARALAGEP